jgi:tetratricopeptide (TPR) repeat protein
MGIAFDRVVDVRAGRPDGTTTMGSGYLVAERLVLTAAHVVFTDAGIAGSVTLRPMGAQRALRGRVVWPPEHGPLDAAVVEILEADWRTPRLAPVRWGRLTGQAGRIGCEAMGFPRVLREPDGTRESEQFDGHLNPGTRLVGRRYDVHVDSSAPTVPAEPAAPSPWAGLSGAGLVAGEQLIGVVVVDTPGFAERRLTAVPVLELTADPGFQALLAGHGDPLELESVELADLFATPPRRRARPSPAQLLRPELATVRFRGRQELLDELTAWCEGEEEVGCWLLVGPGGQGKTRLARELCRQRRGAGWIAGMVASAPDEQTIARLADTTTPVLLVVDYAETRSDQLQRLIRVAWERSPSTPVRLLLLARSPGEWWPQLRRQLPEPLATSQAIGLPPLDDTAAGRTTAFGHAVQDLSHGLAGVDPAVAWSEVAAHLSPPDLTGLRFGSVLTVHMAALTRLLQGGPHPVAEHASARTEDLLLDHEQRYWEQTATAHQLPYHPHTLRNAVAAATVCGAATRPQALATIARVPGLRDQPEDRRLAVATWLHDLYPTTEEHYWGSLQPDRLGEHLIGRVVHNDPELLGQLLTDAADSQVYLAVTVLARGTSHQRQLAGQLRDLVTADPVRLGPVAIRVATETADPQPLIDALRHAAAILSMDDLATLVDRLPEHSFNLAPLAADLTQQRVDGSRQRAQTDPDAFLPDLAMSLNNLSIRLADVGRREDALAASEEAVVIRRTLAEARPDAFLPNLASALNNLGIRLAALGRPEDALAASEEAAGHYRTLAEARPDAFLPDLAMSLNNLSIRLAEVGRPEDALAASEEATGHYRTLAEARPDAFLPDLAGTLNNLSLRLAEVGRPEDALAASEEAAGIRRRPGEAS